MATIEQHPEQVLSVSDWSDADRSKASRYLAQRLAETRSDYKSVALASFTLCFAVAGLVWLALGVLLEHWWLVGGMPVWLRWTWLLVGLGGAIAAMVRWLVPLLRYRVNLVYAARTIEREFPELHNDLVNAVLVRPAGGDSRASLIARSLDRRAARQLTSIPADDVIDKQHLVRLAAVLAVLVIGASLYALLSPKNPFVSAARLIAPWSSWAAPSRVAIESVECFWTTAAAEQPVQPRAELPAGERLLDPRRSLPVDRGRVQLVRGRQLVLAAAISSLRSEETPLVEVTPLLDDGQVDRKAEPWQTRLRWSAEADRYLVRLPAAAAGLDRSVRLSLTAGDARLQPFDVLVVDAPSLLVREAEYRFPDYTARPPETRQWQGDLRGLEGTEVRLEVESNQPLDAAWIDFLDTEREDDLRLVVDRSQPTLARGSLTLRMAADRTTAEHPSYRLRFRPQVDGQAGVAAVISEPLTHRIEVLPDLAPEVAIDHPEADPLRVPPRAAVRIKVRAVDPDYAVSLVRVETRARGGAAVRDRVLWQTDPARPDARGSSGLRVSTRVVPAEEAAGAAAIEYRAVVLDNRQPAPNSSATPWRQLIVDELAPPPADPEPQWPERKPDQPNREPPADGESSAAGPSGGNDTKPRPPEDQRPDQKQTSDQKPAGGSQDQAEQPQEDRPQQPNQPGGESGLQDASGTAGPKEGQGQQGPGMDKQQPGQPGGGRQSPEQGEGQPGGPTGESAGSGKQPAGEPQRNEGAGKPGAAGRDGESAEADSGQQGKPADGQQQPGKPANGNDSGRDNGGEQRPGDGEQRPGDGKQAGRDGRRQDRQQGGGEQQADGGERPAGQPAAEAEPKPTVAADGTDDGEAIERILDHQRRQSGGDQDQDQERQQGGRQQEGEQRSEQGEQGEQQDAQQQGECRPEEGEPCGKAGCSTCKGGGGQEGGQEGGDAAGQPGQMPGDEGSAGGAKAGGDGAAAGEQAAGQEPAAEVGDQPGDSEPAGGAGKAADPAADADAAGGQPGDGDAQGGADGQSGGEQGSESQPEAAEGAGGKSGGNPAGSTAGGGGGGRDGGDQPADRADEAAAAAPKPLEWETQDLSAVRRAADLALNHLRDSVRSGDDAVLEELGWTREQAEAFLHRWETMKRAAETGSADKQQVFDRTLRSLGLRPEGVRSSRQVPTDQRGPQTEGRRTKPPLDYRERFRAFLKGTGGQLENE